MKSEDKLNFSVLICVYAGDNDEYFEIALKSITHDQTLKPTQIVLVVDGPLGANKNIIIDDYVERFNFIDVVRIDRNSGLVNALNIGLSLCKYNLIARMDSDDISAPDRFELQLRHMMLHPEVDVLSSFIEEFNDNGLMEVRTLPLEMPEIVRFSRYRSPINHGACMYKKDAVIKAGGYEKYNQLQDYYLFVKMIKRGAVFRNLSNVLLMVRMVDGYNRKSGFNYFREELSLATNFYLMRHINFIELIRNLILRAMPRLMPSRIVGFLYRKLYR